MKNLLKLLLILLGNGILVYGIIISIDGIGRFAMILFGLIFSITGACLSWKKRL